ncbi:uncharacterized protein I303_104117 [Kwoniella dejecticola CBS 10117]|uniref:Major facilitator superfamily (MFS) profile domain-containing protein n=1 Tax=Kwoniella dejecticola CBS 10117 TaxID=1296121 RepID=A0A1A6A680_9TREE|nr:uncharacterized protein I303_04904 [Kwoniella dejecticola CBS 10117]OBR85568.1 hypothetical protein I303_04904 [Kwoniella dejecticola CBS 10117]
MSSIPTATNRYGNNFQLCMNLLVVIPTFLAMGLSQSWMGGVASYKSFYRQFPQIDTSTTEGDIKAQHSIRQGAVNASLNLGAIVGCLSCIWLGNCLGRRKTIVLGAAITNFGTVLMCTSFSMPQFCVARVCLGAGLGMMSSTVPVWQSEISKVHKRGHHVIVDGICIAGGIAASGWLTYGFWRIDTTSSWQWRIPGMFPGIFATLVLLFTFIFPESPRWLVLKSRIDEARAIFALVEGTSPEDPRVAHDLEAVIRLNEAAAESASLSSLFVYGKEKMLYRLALAVSVQWFTQMNGAGLITYYSNQLFATIGLDTGTSKVVAACALTWKWVCCFIAFFTIERAGRRKLFMISGAGMSVCMFCLAICGSQVSDDRLAPAYAGVVFAFIFLFFLPIGYLGVNFLYCQEIITSRYRAPASGISTATHWLTAFAVSLTTPLGFTSIGWKYYLIWGASSATIVPTVYFFYPETTGLSVEEIDKVFLESNGISSLVKDAERARKAIPRNAPDTVARVEHMGNVDEKPENEFIEKV